jgi:uncharacterized protein
VRLDGLHRGLKEREVYLFLAFDASAIYASVLSRALILFGFIRFAQHCRAEPECAIAALALIHSLLNPISQPNLYQAQVKPEHPMAETNPVTNASTHLDSHADAGTSKRVRRVAEQIRLKFEGEGSGHDWYHIQRVWHMAKRIAVSEGVQGTALEVVELGALVHDIADWKFHGGDDSIGPREAAALLASVGASAALIDEVVDIVATISYKGAGVKTPMKTLAGQCVQDADRLDAVGAIGIARAFAYGGHAGRPMYDPDAPATLHQSGSAYKSAKSASLNHFYEKLFLLKDRMNTATGRAIAEERHHFMVAFEQRFLAEWEGRDPGASEAD